MRRMPDALTAFNTITNLSLALELALALALISARANTAKSLQLVFATEAKHAYK